MNLAALRTQLRGLLEPAVQAAGLDLEDVAVSRAGSRSVVRVVVDSDPDTGRGVDLDAVADVSRRISEVLDADPDVVAGAYVLEVTSPGVDRPLTLPRHWRRARGRLVKGVLRDGRQVSGRVRDADDDEAGAVTLEADGAMRRVAYADVAKATVEVEFARAGEAG